GTSSFPNSQLLQSESGISLPEKRMARRFARIYGDLCLHGLPRLLKVGEGLRVIVHQPARFTGEVGLRKGNAGTPWRKVFIWTGFDHLQRLGVSPLKQL